MVVLNDDIFFGRGAENHARYSAVDYPSFFPLSAVYLF